MPKPLSTIILSALLAFSWVWFLVINTGMAKEDRTPGRPKWEYTNTTDEKKLDEFGSKGWEAYAVTHVEARKTWYYLKRPIQYPHIETPN